MLSQRELDGAIREFEDAPTNYENCAKLATFYTIFDHLYGDPKTERKPQEVIGAHGNSEFLQLVQNKDAEEMWGVIDELMDTLKVLHPRLYEGVIQKIAG